MTDSAKRRHVARYRVALDRVAEIDSDIAADVEDYVIWLQDQITAKRQINQALRAEVDELGGGHDVHAYRNRNLEPHIDQTGDSVP
jgi:hypothetical protein